MPLTRIDLVNLALSQSQLDSSYQTKARGWLNLIIDRLALRRNYKFYYKTATDVPFIAGQQEYTLPLDYQRSDSCFLVQNGQKGNEILIVEPYRFDQLDIGNVTGNPVAAVIKLETQTIRFNVAPSQGTTVFYRFNYWRSPASLSTDASDDLVVPDFEDQDILIQELMKWAYEFTDDERLGDKKMDMKEAHREHQRNMYESDGTGQMDLARDMFRPRTNTRGRGNFNT